MLRWASSYLGSIPPVFIDGLTYVLIAFFGSVATGLGTDDAAKYVSPEALFWLRMFCGAMGATLISLKMYRSTAYSDHLASKEKANTIEPLRAEPNKDIPTP